MEYKLMHHQCSRFFDITPTYLTELLSDYISVPSTPKYDELLSQVRNRFKLAYRKYKQSCTRPTLVYLHKSILGSINATRKRLLDSPLSDMPDQFYINTIILMEWYSKVSNSKGDRDLLLREFLWQYAAVVRCFKYNKLPPAYKI